MSLHVNPDIFKAYRRSRHLSRSDQRRGMQMRSHRRRVCHLPELAKRQIAVGCDMRLSSPSIAATFIDGYVTRLRRRLG